MEHQVFSRNLVLKKKIFLAQLFPGSTRQKKLRFQVQETTNFVVANPMQNKSKKVVYVSEDQQKTQQTIPTKPLFLHSVWAK